MTETLFTGMLIGIPLGWALLAIADYLVDMEVARWRKRHGFEDNG